MSNAGHQWNAFDPKQPGKSDDILLEEGPVKVTRGGANIKGADERFAELGQRRIRLRSGPSARSGNFLTLTQDDIAAISQKNGGKWLAGIAQTKESDVNGTNTNRSARPMAPQAAAPVQRNRVNQPVPKTAAAPARRPVVQMRPVAPAPVQEVYDDPSNMLKSRASWTDSDNRCNDLDDDDGMGTAVDPIGLMEDRISMIENSVNLLVTVLEEKKEAESASSDFYWCNEAGKPLPPQHVVKMIMTQITMEARFHLFSVSDNCVMLGFDSRDTHCSRSFPNVSEDPFEIQWIDNEGNVASMLVGHIGLQSSLGPLDIIVLPHAKPEDSMEANHEHVAPPIDWDAVHTDTALPDSALAAGSEEGSGNG